MAKANSSSALALAPEPPAETAEVHACFGTIGSQLKGCPVKNCQMVEACGKAAAAMVPAAEITGDGTGETLHEIDEGSMGHCRKHDQPAPLNQNCLDEQGADYVLLCSQACADWMPPVLHAAMAEPEPPEDKRRPDYRVIDNNTGELVQLSLLGAEWESYKVETDHVSMSYGDEFIKTLLDELVIGGELSPGAIVEVVSRGTVQRHAPVFKKGVHSGDTVIALKTIQRITVLGHMTGAATGVEAAQNVDGEPKVLEEEPAEFATRCWLGQCAQYSEDDERQSLCLFDESKPLPVTGVTECPHVGEREPTAAYADLGDVVEASDEGE